MEITDKVIYISRQMPCPVELLWEKWTTNEGIKSFFAADSNIELKINGKYEIYFSTDAPLGSRGSEGCRILAYEPKRQLVFSWNAPPVFENIRNGDYYTWVVLQFNSLSDGNSLFELTHAGWPLGEDWDKVYDYFTKAWNSVTLWLYDSLLSST